MGMCDVVLAMPLAPLSGVHHCEQLMVLIYFIDSLLLPAFCPGFSEGKPASFPCAGLLHLVGV